MNNTGSVAADLVALRKALAKTRANPFDNRSAKPWRPALDIAFDWALVFLAVLAVCCLGWIASPFAIFVIANRQRALGNLLHDAGHQNLFRSRAVNDGVASLCIAPALFNDLGRYRDFHFRHHAVLGVHGRDPDKIAVQSVNGRTWWPTFSQELFSRANWTSSIAGHLAQGGVGWRARAFIFGWWCGFAALLMTCTEPRFALTFFVLWMTARATVFHFITMFREMCDHFGLEPGGIYSYTRDIVVPLAWRWIVHPHQNCYHLTHHLLPSVPYHQLPAAQKALEALPDYARRAVVCRAYFLGGKAVVRLRGVEARLSCARS